MKIAIVGAGYAGLSLCWHLLERKSVQITVFDDESGQGASIASTGLLHPYPGKFAKRAFRADEAMREANRLIEAAGEYAASSTGILRLAVIEEQIVAFQKVSDDAQVLNDEAVQRLFPKAPAKTGLMIPGGKTVFSKPYLRGLWLSCERKGAKREKQRIESIEELKSYDQIVLACGHDILRFGFSLPLKSRHGQALVCLLPEKIPCSLIGNGHLSLTEDPTLCLLGSTYEDSFDPDRALALKEQIAAFYPPARDFKVLDRRAGVRIAPQTGHLPLILQVSPSIWVFTGLGSRGLLYGGLYGMYLSQKILEGVVKFK